MTASTPEEPTAADELSTLAARLRARVVPEVNKQVPGAVTLHYKSRDVDMEMPGDAALRLMIMFRRQRADGLDSIIDLTSSSALSGWVTVGTEGLLAISWDPGVDAYEAVEPGLLALFDSLDAADGPGGPAAVARLVDQLRAVGEPDAANRVDKIGRAGSTGDGADDAGGAADEAEGSGGTGA